MSRSSRLVKKIFFGTWVLVVLFAANAVLLSASPAAIVKVEPYATTAKKGDIFKTNITVADVQNLYGLDVKLQWNASVLQIAHVDLILGKNAHPDGVLYEEILLAKNETDNDEGSYWLAATSYNSTIGGVRPPSFNGSGNIAEIAFRVKNSGNTWLTLETRLADKPLAGAVAAEITHTVTNGIFSTIHLSVSPSTVTLGDNVNASGFTALFQGNISVTIQERRKGTTDWANIQTVETNENGIFQLIWKPNESGYFEIKASAIIEDTMEFSYLVDLTVKTQAQIPAWQYVQAILVIAIVVGVLAALIYQRKLRKRRNLKVG